MRANPATGGACHDVVTNFAFSNLVDESMGDLDQVYDVTSFLDDHPGGGESITINAGQDSTEAFNDLHSDKARRDLQKYYIGDLVSAVKVGGAVPLPCLRCSLSCLHPTS